MKTVFFSSPIGQEGSEVRESSDNLLKYIIEPVCSKLGYEALRSDKIAGASSITYEITKKLLESDLVIFDLSYQNPNVMYELGIRHTLGKPAILLLRDGERIPFDVATVNIIFYSLTNIRSVETTKKKLETSIKYYETEKVANSPVVDFHLSSKILANQKDNELSLSTEENSLLRTIADRLATLETQIKLVGNEVTNKGQKTEYSRDIFIVHGHDGELKIELARFLERLGFNPIILHEQPDKGQTIIQKLQNEGAKVGYAFILHTPDDEGRAKNLDSELQPRARQNVIFEHGMFVGQFTHQRVCAIVKEGVEIPTDLSGIVYKRIPKDGGIDSIALSLIQELRSAGYVVDANRVFGPSDNLK